MRLFLALLLACLVGMPVLALEGAPPSQKVVNYRQDKYVAATNYPSLESCVLSLVSAGGEGTTLHIYPSGPFLSPVGRLRINDDLLFVEMNGTEIRQLDIYDLRTNVRTPARFGQYYVSRNGSYVFSFDSDEGNCGLCLEYYKGKYAGLVILKEPVAGRLAFRRNRKAREFLAYNALTASGAIVRKTLDLTELVKDKGL